MVVDLLIMVAMPTQLSLEAYLSRIGGDSASYRSRKPRWSVMKKKAEGTHSLSFLQFVTCSLLLCPSYSPSYCFVFWVGFAVVAADVNDFDPLLPFVGAHFVSLVMLSNRGSDSAAESRTIPPFPSYCSNRVCYWPVWVVFDLWPDDCCLLWNCSIPSSFDCYYFWFSGWRGTASEWQLPDHLRKDVHC